MFREREMSTAKNSLIAAGSAAALAFMAGTASAQALQPDAAALGQNIAAVAATAESGVSPDAVQQTVTVAVQGVIIASAADPRLVLAALDETLSVCQSADRRSLLRWRCPGSAGSFAAISSLRAIVLAQADQSAPAALGTRGFAAFGSIPTTSAGGAGYQRP